MKIVLNTHVDNNASRLWIHALQSRLVEADIDATLNDWQNYERYDVAVFMGQDHDMAAAKRQNPSIRIALADPKQSPLQSIQAARVMAEAEAAHGWSATYFVLVRTEMYNPFAPAAARDLARIRAFGHRVGLHLDTRLYDNTPAALDAAAAKECAVLETILAAPVEEISFHRPAPDLLGYDAPLAGRRHAYQLRYFTAMGYCSDSGGEWHHGHPLDHPAIAEGRAIQLLTHPIWWTMPVAAPADRLQALLDARSAVLDRELGLHCATHRRRYPEETPE